MTFNPKNDLMLLHINIRLVQKNIDLFYKFIKSLQFLPHIICLSESHIKSQPSLNLSISNSTFLHVNSETNAGGIAMYIQDILKFRICQKQHQLTNSEALWIKIENFNEHPTINDIVYRHPDSSTIDELKIYLVVSLNSIQTNILNTWRQ